MLVGVQRTELPSLDLISFKDTGIPRSAFS